VPLPEVLPDVLPDEPPVAPPDGDVGVRFFASVVLPAEPLVEPLVLPDGLAVLPPLAERLLSLSQPDKSVPAKASAKATVRIRFMGCGSFPDRKRSNNRACRRNFCCYAVFRALLYRRVAAVSAR